MWKSTYVGVYQLLNWKMHGEILKLIKEYFGLCVNKVTLQRVPRKVSRYMSICNVHFEINGH